MVRKSVFNQDYGWFKGNLHTHSTQSDGILDPAEVARRYQEQGWNFLALTDHDFYSNWQERTEMSFSLSQALSWGAACPDLAVTILWASQRWARRPSSEKEQGVSPQGYGRGSVDNQRSDSRQLPVNLLPPRLVAVEWDDIKDIHGLLPWRFTTMDVP